MMMMTQDDDFTIFGDLDREMRLGALMHFFVNHLG